MASKPINSQPQTKDELVVQKTIQIPNGNYTGEIVSTGTRDSEKDGESFTYRNFGVAIDGTEQQNNGKRVVVNVSIPNTISANTALGKLVAVFAETDSIEVGAKYDISKLFLNKNVEFTTLNKETEKGTFATILVKTLKPIE